MANVFDKIGDIKNNIRRNNFDWSHDNNFTTGLGRIIPLFCTQVPAGSSLRIKPTFGLQFMPMMFPVQTKVKAYLSAYRMPLRALWKDYKDWVSSANDQSSSLEPPYMAFSPDFGKGEILGVSGLSDYLGLPVTASLDSATVSDGNFGNIIEPASSLYRTMAQAPVFLANSPVVAAIDNEPYQNYSLAASKATINDDFFRTCRLSTAKVSMPTGAEQAVMRVTLTFSASQKYGILILRDIESSRKSQDGDNTFGGIYARKPTNSVSIASKVGFRAIFDTDNITWYQDSAGNYYFTFVAEGVVLNDSTTSDDTGMDFFLFMPNVRSIFTGVNESTAGMVVENMILETSSGSTLSLDSSTTPYYMRGSQNVNSLKISAYPYRTYEAIYNAYIRNNKNNPFLIDGKPVYNTWIPTDKGGADQTDYQLHHANWASDMFTTAVPSPQQGSAPLVGITTYESTRTLENGHTETVLNTALVDEDGNKFKVNFESNGEELKNVSYTQLSADTPVRPLSSLYDLVTSGISINDFRNVNAYQRYLELNMFRGYSYKDIVEGRFDVNIRYDDLNMPEYLGGCTRDVIINPITQTVQVNSSGKYEDALGSQSGLGLLRGDCENISCYCDEESIVMVLLSVVPMPVYTQALPKHFLYRERLDSFNPEFDNIGFQPIRMSEIAPVQQWVSDPNKMNDVFGYQRPWYEYCQQLDTAHGLFKTQLRNFLINRVFGSVPELGAAFTTVDENEVNDVFAVTDVSDKILGQVHFDITAKLPISRVVVPKLE